MTVSSTPPTGSATVSRHQLTTASDRSSRPTTTQRPRRLSSLGWARGLLLLFKTYWLTWIRSLKFKRELQLLRPVTTQSRYLSGMVASLIYVSFLSRFRLILTTQQDKLSDLSICPSGMMNQKIFTSRLSPTSEASSSTWSLQHRATCTRPLWTSP